MRIDSHHHLWRYTAEDYGWIDDSMAGLRRDFLPMDLRHETVSAGVGGTIAVQARQSLEETEWLLGLARENPLIRGVVGWAPLAARAFERQLATLRQDALLRGLRHVVQGEPAGFLDDLAFNQGLRALQGTGLVYDLLIYARQMREATRFVGRHPNQVFVLDHIGKPDIKGGGWETWAADISELARHPNVFCKVSGMVTEADWSRWTASELQPYFDSVLEAFGASRLMAGSDWPVLSVACGYGRWWQIVDEWTATLSEDERASIEGGVAQQVYGISGVGL